MDGNERDTHFKGFAELLYQELSKLEGSHETLISEYRNKYDKEDILRLISRRAYDLVCHTLRNTAYGIDRFYISDQVNDNIPDLDEWPSYHE